MLKKIRRLEIVMAIARLSFGLVVLAFLLPPVFVAADDTVESSTDDAAASETTAEKSMQAVVLNAKLQVLGMSYAKGETRAMNDLRIAKLTEVVDQKYSRVRVKMYLKVRDVDWEDGVARITTEPDFTDPKPVRGILVSKSSEHVTLTRRRPIEVLMGQEEAAAITPDTLVLFKGLLDFQPADPRSPQAADAQHVYSVRHKGLGRQIGEFASRDYLCVVAGKEYPGRWAAGPESDLAAGE